MRKKESKKRKKYVTYDQVQAGLCRPHCRYDRSLPRVLIMECEPRHYIQTLKKETGLAYWKIAHDLRVDSGCDVSDGAVTKWGKESNA